MKLHKIIMYNTSEIEKVEGKKRRKHAHQYYTGSDKYKINTKFKIIICSLVFFPLSLDY